MRTMKTHATTVRDIDQDTTGATARSAHARRTLAAVAAAGLLLAGCVPIALLPYYQARDVIQDPALVGLWKENADAKEVWNFEAGKDQSYRLTLTDDEGTGPMEAHLFQLGEQRFLDLCVGENGFEGFKRPGLFMLSLLPGHVLLRVDQIQPQLQMQVLKEDWTREWLSAHPDALEHRLLGEGKDTRVVFTATTAAMQQFLKQHLADTNAWSLLRPLQKMEK